ncbi:HAMP domain-containing sensor histidine kinase [Pseudorhodobacter sp.]|uniref:sensor histidine kinase n=1 Tax=Pseudorhodobacter sp. TaxID=1934400 RepID=UPI002647019B|nr:HAMP domain-containing sensor histidine kinase [Pseudorhodobacter sp.]MDN5788094.1 HAMP domain-containing histidine kinase [Pseudorhodobacter sp.]
MRLQLPQARATLRLAAVVALTVTLLSLLGMVLQYRLVERRLMQAQTALLAADLDGFAALYDQRRIIALRQAIDYRAAAATGDEMLLLQDRDGRVLAGTRQDWPATLPAIGEDFSADQAQVFRDAGQNWLGVGRVLPGGFPLLVARALTPMEATLTALRQMIALLTLGMLVAGGVVGWIAARRIMGRITRINTLADRVAAGALDARLPGPRAADEFGLLETHVHAMLDRIEALNRATHRLSDSIAHELRTPLNRMSQKLAQLQGQDALVDDLRDEMRKATRVFDALLDISRAEADQGFGGGLVPVDLSALCAEMVELYEAVAEESGLTLHHDIQPGQMILGDCTLIGQMLANLLDNAVKYCASGDEILLALTPNQNTITLTIRDTGPGLPADIKAQAFERFTRAERDRGHPGHGLGLALVRAIATRHGAKLSLPEVEKGFELQILWPKLIP